MKRIGLLSDTHAHWDDRYLHHFEECDEIWHAGDLGSIELAMRLQEFRPLKAVFGNCDGGNLRIMFSEKLRWNCEGADVFMTHIGGYPGRYDLRIRQEIHTNPPKLFISGHSHILKVLYDDKLNLLHINPGAAGLQGWHQVRTLIRFTIEDASFKDLEVIEIPR
jgi:putative phosphoesterase